MLNLCLSFILVVGAYNIYTYFFLGNLSTIINSFILTLFIDLCLFMTSLLDEVIFLYYDSFWVYTIFLCITSLESIPGKK